MKFNLNQTISHCIIHQVFKKVTSEFEVNIINLWLNAFEKKGSYS